MKGTDIMKIISQSNDHWNAKKNGWYVAQYPVENIKRKDAYGNKHNYSGYHCILRYKHYFHKYAYIFDLAIGYDIPDDSDDSIKAALLEFIDDHADIINALL